METTIVNFGLVGILRWFQDEVGYMVLVAAVRA